MRDYQQPALIEPFLPGAEYTVCLIGTHAPRAARAPARARGDSGIGSTPSRACPPGRRPYVLPGELTPALEGELPRSRGRIPRAALRLRSRQRSARNAATECAASSASSAGVSSPPASAWTPAAGRRAAVAVERALQDGSARGGVPTTQTVYSAPGREPTSAGCMRHTQGTCGRERLARRDLRLSRMPLERAFPARLHEERKPGAASPPPPPPRPTRPTPERREPQRRDRVLRPRLVEREHIPSRASDTEHLEEDGRPGLAVPRPRPRRCQAPGVDAQPRTPARPVRQKVRPPRTGRCPSSRIASSRAAMVEARLVLGQDVGRLPGPPGAPLEAFEHERCGGWTWRERYSRDLVPGAELEVSPARRAAAWLPVVIWLGVVIVFLQGLFSADWSLAGMVPLPPVSLPSHPNSGSWFTFSSARARTFAEYAVLAFLAYRAASVSLPALAAAAARAALASPSSSRRVVAPVPTRARPAPARRRDRPRRARCSAPGVWRLGPPPEVTSSLPDVRRNADGDDVGERRSHSHRSRGAPSRS